MHAMTIDVEDYFQVGAFEKLISPEKWDSMPHRVEANTNKLLHLFAEEGNKATFFCLGWIAQRYPDMIRRIVEEGHELASHGTMHQRASRQSPEEFRRDVGSAKRLLEDISGKPILGYRAPSFSFTKQNLWVYEILADEGYIYSSSVYPIVHDHYGIPDSPRAKYKTSSGIDEIPLSTVRIFGKNIPVSGGGYFRLYPYWMTRMAVSRFQHKEAFPYIFYMHPWEIDPEQPRIEGASMKSRFRHYLNLDRVQSRLTKLLREFQWGTMSDVYGYAKVMQNSYA